MNLNRYLQITILASFLILSSGCKKEKFDSPPESSFEYTVTYLPELPLTLATNFSGTSTGFGFRRVDPVDYYYTGGIFLDRPYVSPLFGNRTISYFFRMGLILNNELKAQTYNCQTTGERTLPGILTWKAATGEEYSWQGNLTNCFSKVIFTEIFTRKLDDGKTHTYASGTIDATMFGTKAPDENAIAFSAITELRFQCSFTAAEITE